MLSAPSALCAGELDVKLFLKDEIYVAQFVHKYDMGCYLSVREFYDANDASAQALQSNLAYLSAILNKMTTDYFYDKSAIICVFRVPLMKQTFESVGNTIC